MESVMIVVPRDLFCHALLLKNIGKLVNAIQDRRSVVEGLKLDLAADDQFIIEQDPSDGSIYVSNLIFTWQKRNLHFFRTLNCKDSWSLWVSGQADDYQVMRPEGEITDFLQALHSESNGIIYDG